MKLTKIVFCLLLLGGLSTSCIHEEYDECFSTNTLLLSYKGDGTTEIFPSKINRVDMYIFDAENRCVNSRTLPADQVASQTAQLPPLPAGDYRIVCIGNPHHTEVKGIESGDFNQMLFADKNYYAGTVVNGNDSLYYASIPYTVLPFSAYDNEHSATIPFASSHYDVSVEVAGVPEGSGVVLEIDGVTPCTDFENHVQGSATDYTFTTRYDAAKLQLDAFANIMRHTNHADVNVRLLPATGGEPLAVVNLKEFLAAHPYIDTTKNEVLIPIRIEFREGHITITVPQWYVEQVKPEF